MFYIGLGLVLLAFAFVFYLIAVNVGFLEALCDFLEAITLTILIITGFSLMLAV